MKMKFKIRLSDEEYKKIDFKKIYSKANEIIALSKSVNIFPFKVKKLVYEFSDIKIVSFKTAKEKFNIDIKLFGSESAIIQECNGVSIIFYNQDEKPQRVKFSIIHEFGHFILGHKMNLTEDDPLYHRQEVEANCFAAQILMPEQILRKCSDRGYYSSPEYIKGIFDVSDEASEKRRDTLAKTNYDWKSREEKEYDDIILLKYNDFINSVAPYKAEFYSYEDEYEKQQERDTWFNGERW